MGKHEVGTPKYIANKMKSKGLQKLRWYCQMCQKQCRDENGFKCHTTSESHQRNLLMFADNSKKYMDEFSKEFLDGWMDLLRRQYGTKRIAANKVYQDYIADRHHVHMNATRWVTLTGFVKWLGRTGKCVVDETERGWFIQYIDRDPETLAREERKAKKHKMDRDDEDKLMQFVQKGQKSQSEESASGPTEFVRSSEETKISLQLKSKPPKKPFLLTPTPIPLDKQVASSSKTTENVFVKPDTPKESMKRKPEEIEEPKKEHKASKQDKEVPWVTKSVGPRYQNEKGFVEQVSGYQAIVIMLSNNHKLKLDQEHLQTVIPKLGRSVKILKGPHRNRTAILKEILIEKYKGLLSIMGTDGKETLKEMPYESFSKLFVAPN
ncbi:hypothetical protein B566_EDAN002668 [Ephemera danica]|nr:hypothetical protein B566_EDAN002668 [Ephemera danica]